MPRKIKRFTRQQTANRPILRPLRDILRYRNPGVVKGFLKKYAIEPVEADMLFKDALRLLWFGIRTGKPITMTLGQYLLDEMLHTFILHTKEYVAFCRKYLGGYVHHTPEPVTDKPLSRRAEERNRDEMREGIGRVYEILGPEVATRWYYTWPRRHTLEYVMNHLRPPKLPAVPLERAAWDTSDAQAVAVPTPPRRPKRVPAKAISKARKNHHLQNG